MEENKSMFYIVSIIAVVAIVGLIVLIINSTHSNGVIYTRTPTISTAGTSDSAGQAIISVDPNGGMAEEKEPGINIYAIPAHGVIAEANNAGPVGKGGVKPLFFIHQCCVFLDPYEACDRPEGGSCKDSKCSGADVHCEDLKIAN